MLCICVSVLLISVLFYNEADDLLFVEHNTNNGCVFTLPVFVLFKKNASEFLF